MEVVPRGDLHGVPCVVGDGEAHDAGRQRPQPADLGVAEGPVLTGTVNDLEQGDVGTAAAGRVAVEDRRSPALATRLAARTRPAIVLAPACAPWRFRPRRVPRESGTGTLRRRARRAGRSFVRCESCPPAAALLGRHRPFDRRAPPLGDSGLRYPHRRPALHRRLERVLATPPPAPSLVPRAELLRQGGLR